MRRLTVVIKHYPLRTSDRNESFQQAALSLAIEGKRNPGQGKILRFGSVRLPWKVRVKRKRIASPGTQQI